jgi:Kazal-type serine protease inhibitor domain
MFRLGWAAISCCVLLLGCPADDDGTDDAADTTTDASSTSQSTTASTTVTTDTTTASTTVSTTDATVTTDATTSEGSATDPSETDTDATTDTGGGACDACDVGEYCDWSVNSCGARRFDEPGCAPIPDGCPAVEEDPVCGCDGVVYAGECAAALLGVDIDVEGECTAPAGTFACGYKYCDAALSYCQWSVSDVGGSPDGYGCVPLPQGCDDAPSCACVADEPCAEFSCEPTDDGGLLVTCPGG